MSTITKQDYNLANKQLKELLQKHKNSALTTLERDPKYVELLEVITAYEASIKKTNPMRVLYTEQNITKYSYDNWLRSLKKSDTEALLVPNIIGIKAVLHYSNGKLTGYKIAYPSVSNRLVNVESIPELLNAPSTIDYQQDLYIQGVITSPRLITPLSGDAEANVLNRVKALLSGNLSMPIRSLQFIGYLHDIHLSIPSLGWNIKLLKNLKFYPSDIRIATCKASRVSKILTGINSKVPKTEQYYSSGYKIITNSDVLQEVVYR